MHHRTQLSIQKIFNSIKKRIGISSLALLLFYTIVDRLPALGEEALDVLPIYVGHGSTTLIKNRCFTAVYDIGGEKQYFDSVINELTTKKKNDHPKYIDIMLISHSHKDHISYLRGLIKKGFLINTLITNDHTLAKLSLIPGFNNSVQQAIGFSATLDKNTETITARNISDCNIDLTFEIFWGTTTRSQELGKKYNKKKGNNDSLVVGIFGNSLKKPILFLGDSNSIAQKYLLKYKSSALADYNNSTLFVGHHGYSNGINTNFLRYISPSAAVISRSTNTPMLKKDLIIINSFLKPVQDKLKTQIYEVLCSPLPRNSRYKQHLKAGLVCPIRLSSDIFILSPDVQLNLSK